MINFNREKLLITLSNVLLYVSFILSYFYAFHKTTQLKYVLFSLALLFASLFFIALFMYVKFKFLKKNNILAKIQKSHWVKIKLFIIFELITFLFVIIAITIAWINQTPNFANTIIFIVIALAIIFLTISASFLETILRFQLINSKHLNPNVQVIK